MHKILISRCLLGELVRYDGRSNPIDHPVILKWQQQDCLVALCPEVSGSLPIPRPPAEIQPDGRVLAINGEDVTEQFNQGAKHAQDLCLKHNIKLAILKQSSPSCGSRFIYDGSFNGVKIEGQGITTTLLRQNGIAVFCEKTLDDAIACYQRLEKTLAE